MIRRITCLVVIGALALSVWGVSAASAQEPQGKAGGRGGRGPGGFAMGAGGGVSLILRSETVQKDV